MSSTNQITGNEAFWGPLQGSLPSGILDEINKSPTLVNELMQYGAAVGNGSMQAMSVNLGSANLLQFTGHQVEFGSNWATWSPEQFVGNLSHEIGHLVNLGNDTQFFDSLQINPNDPNAGALYSAVGLHAEGEAVYNNWLVQQEIVQNGGSAVYINGDSGSNGKIDQALNALHASDTANGLSSAQDTNAMIELAGKMFSGLHPSGTDSTETYADMYSAHGGEIFSDMGIAPGKALPGAIDEVDFTNSISDGSFSSITEKFTNGDSTSLYFNNSSLASSVETDPSGNIVSQIIYSRSGNGNYNADIYDAQGHLTNEDQFHADGSEVAYQVNADGSQVATVYNTSGNETEYATFGTDGKKTLDAFFDATTGRETQENHFNADGSQVDYTLNTDGSQSATVYNTTGHETEYASFGTDGKKTLDVFFDATTGRETQENHLSADGSQTDYLLNADGSTNAVVFNASGHETEYATFGTNGQKTQDVFFFDANTGRETQENDINADGSQIDHVFNANGTQNSTVFNAAGHETEYASFGTDGKMTQDVFFDSNTGRETQENDINADGSQVDHVFNANGTQNSTVYNAAGHETEYASFGTNGKMTQDILFDANTGRETQENDINADGSQVDHVFNTNGTQSATVYNSAGHETEQASFDTNGKLSQDIIFDGNTGRELQETDYNTSGGGVAHVFNPDGTQNAAVFDPSGHVSEYATFGTNGQMTTDAFYDATGRETQLNEYSNTQTIVRTFAADNSQTATVYNAYGNEIEFAKFNSGGQKTDDYFFDHMTGRETEYDQYGNNGSMTAHLFNADNSQDAIIYNGNGQEIEYDAFNSSGQLTGFTQFTYGAGGGYDATTYGPTGYEMGWADFGADGMVVSSGGNAYNFSLSDGYDSGEDDDWDWAAFNNDFGYSGDYGFFW